MMRTEWRGTWFGGGLGAFFGGIAAVTTDSGQMLMAVGISIMTASVIHKYTNTKISFLSAIFAGFSFYYIYYSIFPKDLGVFSISDEQVRKFSSFAIAPSDGPHWITLDIDGTCPDCQAFCYKIRDALNDLPGWKTQISFTTASSGTIKGVQIWVIDRNNQPNSAIVIERALQAAHIYFTVVQTPFATGASSDFVEMQKMEFSIVTGPV